MGKRDAKIKFTRGLVDRIAPYLEKEFGEVFYTQENMQTLTFPVEYEGKTLYASVRLTLHKEDFDLDEAIDAYEDRLFEIQRKEGELRKVTDQNGNVLFVRGGTE